MSPRRLWMEAVHLINSKDLLEVRPSEYNAIHIALQASLRQLILKLSHPTPIVENCG